VREGGRGMSSKGHVLKYCVDFVHVMEKTFSKIHGVFFNWKCLQTGPPTLGQHWLLKQFCLNHPVEHIQKPKLPKLYVKVETSTTYFIIHNQFVKNCSLSDQLFCSIFLQSPSRQQSYQIMDCK